MTNNLINLVTQYYLKFYTFREIANKFATNITSIYELNIDYKKLKKKREYLLFKDYKTLSKQDFKNKYSHLSSYKINQIINKYKTTKYFTYSWALKNSIYQYYND